MEQYFYSDVFLSECTKIIKEKCQRLDESLLGGHWHSLYCKICRRQKCDRITSSFTSPYTKPASYEEFTKKAEELYKNWVENNMETDCKTIETFLEIIKDKAAECQGNTTSLTKII